MLVYKGFRCIPLSDSHDRPCLWHRPVSRKYGTIRCRVTRWKEGGGWNPLTPMAYCMHHIEASTEIPSLERGCCKIAYTRSNAYTLTLPHGAYFVAGDGNSLKTILRALDANTPIVLLPALRDEMYTSAVFLPSDRRSREMRTPSRQLIVKVVYCCPFLPIDVD